jgi:NitT/TauT family transport system substrate-binding protein
MITRRRLAALAGMLPIVAQAHAQASGRTPLRIGQATPTISFLPIMAARALGSFAAAGLELDWAAIPGGDPTALADLDGGDIDLAAVGSETVLAAIGRGQPFQIVASLMSKVSLELVVSNAFLKRTGVSPADPLPVRLAALKDCVVGVNAIGGTQDRTARWLAIQGGLDPATEIRISDAGTPSAIQATMENGRIGAFVLSPPEGAIAEDRGYGKILIRIGDSFPHLKGVPSLVLVARTPVANPALVRQALRAMRAASEQVTTDPEGSGVVIQRVLFPKTKPALVTAAVQSLRNGVADGGRLSVAGMTALLRFASDSGGKPIKGLDAVSGEGKFWTNAYFDPAK